jgi:hypothetical protein
VRSGQIVLLAFAVVATFLWSQTVWGTWGGRVYDALGAESAAWMWLRLFKVPVTRENCIRFQKGASSFGILAVVTMTVLVWSRV